MSIADRRVGRLRRPERLLGLIVALLVGAAIVIFVAVSQADDEPPTATPGDLPAGATLAEVVRVSDGDTILVRVDGATERVRYVGVDAPEIAHPEDGIAAECWGEEASAANAALVEGGVVAIERDVSDRDRFGRLLRHVWASDASGWFLVSERLVRDGAVEARSYPPDTGRDGTLDGAERVARAARTGLWGAC